MASFAIAISAFRSDQQVISLLEHIISTLPEKDTPIIVVDSLGSGAIEDAIDFCKWNVIYENHRHNLGSAGNLARRMELALQVKVDWVLCLNHDANWSWDRLAAMLETARSRARVGAVYPLLDHSPRERPWEAGRSTFTPSSRERYEKRPRDEAPREVVWSSSNCALYSTRPFREGLTILADLWMGYEDLAYGIALFNGGWVQLVCNNAVLAESYDYGERMFCGRRIHIPEKPAWYAYYDIRNLLLIRREYGSRGIRRRSIVRKFFDSIVRVTFLEANKADRMKFMALGLFDGWIGKSGKGRCP